MILVVAIGSIGYVALTGDWRVGLRYLAGAMGVAGVLRLTFPEKDAGMLAVRNRFLDTSLLLVVGAAIAFLTVTIPDQPGD
ncbi:DUF3017 domain-containing protein [Nocardioides sambongensis]|uniref:DUF3017 domain-containing protein n=1 Tax=Nocardioides sambongensis TaxID=2589074 RepID=UPI0015E85BD4|nr:DUF3017 domain-containing protein [Nocardioides sambongensis]